MSESEQQEAWKTLIDIFYDSETLEIRAGCDQFFEDVLSMKIAICARLAQTGHMEHALRLWDSITAEQNSSHSSDPYMGHNPQPALNAEVSPVAFSPGATKCIEKNQASIQETHHCIVERPKDGTEANEG